MARLLWLPDVLRAAGLTVHEYQGWRTRGLESFGPVLGIVCHHTASSLTSKDSDEVHRLAITGSLTAAAPISQLYLSRSGAWWVLASGTCTGVRTGIAGPLTGKGDDSVLQIEAQHAGGVEPWTTVQYTSYARGCAALADRLGIDVSFVIGHKEHQPGQKVDPTFDMRQFRRDVAALMSGDEDVSDAYDLLVTGMRPGAPSQTHTPEPRYPSIPNSAVLDRIWRASIDARIAADGVIALKSVVEQLAEVIRQGGGSVDTVGILAGVDERLAAHRAAVGADTRDAVADGFERGAAGVREG